MRTLRQWIPLLLLLSLGLLVIGAPAHASTILDQTTDKFQVAANEFGTRIQGYALKLLVTLAGIQLTLAMLNKILSGAELQDIVLTVIWKTLLPVGFFLFLIYSSSTVLPSVIDSFDLLGQKGSGLGSLTPSAIITQGIQLQTVMVQKFNSATGADQGLMAALQNFFPALMLTACCLIVLASFVVLGAQMCLALISGYFWAAVTPLLLGFGGLSYTKDIALNSLKGGISIGIKIMTIYFIAGVARTLAPIMGEGMGAVTIDDWSPMFWVTAVAMILAYLSFQVPKLAGDLMNGTSSLSAGDAGSNMAMMAAGGVATGATAMGAGGMLMQAASNGAGALASAAQAAFTGSGTLVPSPAEGGAAGVTAAMLQTTPPPGASISSLDSGGAVVPPPWPSSGPISQPQAETGAGQVVAPPPLSVAGTGSIGGSQAGGDVSRMPAPATVQERLDALHSTMQQVEQHLPQDAHTVGLAANISSTHE